MRYYCWNRRHRGEVHMKHDGTIRLASYPVGVLRNPCTFGGPSLAIRVGWAHTKNDTFMVRFNKKLPGKRRLREWKKQQVPKGGRGLLTLLATGDAWGMYLWKMPPLGNTTKICYDFGGVLNWRSQTQQGLATLSEEPPNWIVNNNTRCTPRVFDSHQYTTLA